MVATNLYHILQIMQFPCLLGWAGTDILLTQDIISQWPSVHYKATVYTTSPFLNGTPAQCSYTVPYLAWIC